MGGKRYTQEELCFLEKGIKEMPLDELTVAFNERFGKDKSQTTIYSTLNNYGFKRGQRRVQEPGTRYRAYTVRQIEFVRDIYLIQGKSVPEVAKAFNEEFEDNRSDYAIAGLVQNHGLQRYKKIKRVIDVGDETLCSSTGYITVKTTGPAHNMKTNRCYRYKHLVVWEAHNGPVPKGHVVRFLDGNARNCEIENLALFTRSEHGYLNALGYNEAHEELKETILLTARLMARVNKRRRELEEDVDGVGQDSTKGAFVD